MNIHDALRYLTSQGLELARLAYGDALGGLELDPVEVRTYKAVGAVLYGPCRNKRVRSEILRLAQGFSIARLVVIHKAASQLSRRAPITHWDLRLELTRLKELTLEELRQHARARVRELNAIGAGRPARSLVIGRTPDATGRRTAVLKLPEDEMAALERQLRGIKRPGPEDIAMGNACWQLLTSGTGVRVRTPEPTVLLMADDLRGVGGSMLQATDGTMVEAHEYVTKRMGELGWVLLYDGLARPVNMWRTARGANATQRAIIAADQGQCAWPGCERIALYGAVHHEHAWSQGGNTNLDNLIGLCGPHNAMNDDDPNAPPRNGRMARDEQGHPVWIPPDGGPPVRNRGYHTTRSGRAQMLEAAAKRL